MHEVWLRLREPAQPVDAASAAAAAPADAGSPDEGGSRPAGGDADRPNPAPEDDWRVLAEEFAAARAEPLQAGRAVSQAPIRRVGKKG